MGIIRLAIPLKMPYDKILEAMSYAFFFKATDENGNRPEQDIIFEEYLSHGLDYTLQKVCGMDPVYDRELTEEVKKFINTGIN